MDKVLVEVADFLLAQYEGGSGPVAEQAAELRKKLPGGTVSAASQENNRMVANQTDSPSVPAAETEEESVPHHVADEPLRAHAGKKRKGHA